MLSTFFLKSVNNVSLTSSPASLNSFKTKCHSCKHIGDWRESTQHFIKIEESCSKAGESMCMPLHRLLCGHLWVLCSHWGFLDKASMPCYVCVFPLLRTSFDFPVCSLKVDMNCEWEAFYTCLLAKFFPMTLHQKFQRQTLEFYWQVIKSGPHNLF